MHSASLKIVPSNPFWPLSELSFRLALSGVSIPALSFNPPQGAIDARQPTSLDGTLTFGWQLIDATFTGASFDLLPIDFVVTQEGGTTPPPDVISVLPNTDRSVTLLLSSPINVGVWTTIIHEPSGASTRIGYLPGDVNGDGTSRPLDILSLIDALNGVGTALPIWSSDINRSGVAEASDILREIDLLNGADALDAFNGATLP